MTWELLLLRPPHRYFFVRLVSRYIDTEGDLPLEKKDMSALHRALMENVLHGYDVLPSAVHLTASTLAMLAPEVAFGSTNLYVMPLGMDHGIAKLGSLDFLASNEIYTKMTLDYSHKDTIHIADTASHATKAIVPPLDLCVMNPPYVRSDGGNLLFGSFPDERGELQKELKRRIGKIEANGTVGLGSAFVALADRHLKADGRLAFVLPAGIVSGEAWGKTRKLIAENYHLEIVVSSHDAEHPNFSENTELSEILLIARKRKIKQPGERTTYISLWRNPRSMNEALDIASRIITQMDNSVTVEEVGITTLRGASEKLGEVISLPLAKEKENWTGALFAQTELLRACYSFQRGEGHIPGVSNTFTIPMCRLDDLGTLGYDRRDIHDAFEVSKDDWSPYPAFWGHQAKKVVTIGQKPNASLLARTKAKKGRPLKSSKQVWAKAGRILLAERLWPITQRVLAIGFDTETIGNTWWAFKSESLSIQQEKALLLWLNSSPSLLLYFSRRVITRSAWMQMKKPAWAAMPVLDVRALSLKQVTMLAKTFDSLSAQNLQPLAKLNSDPVRCKIDQGISDSLSIPSFIFMRQLLDREPGMNAIDIAPRSASFEQGGDEEEDIVPAIAAAATKRVPRKRARPTPRPRIVRRVRRPVR